MKIRTFLYFPDCEAAFEALSKNDKIYTVIIKELYAIKHRLKNEDYELYYDSGNVSSFLEAAEGLVDPPYLAGIGNQLKRIISNKSRNVNTPYLRQANCVYATWSKDLNVSCAPFVFSESVEAMAKGGADDKVSCICFGDANLSTDILYIIKDIAKGESEPVITSLTIIGSDVGFIRWISTLSDAQFKLKNNNDFEPLDRYWNKERIYKHKETETCWYFDFFHKENKAHYEVFDSTGTKHLGEADLDGNMRPGTANNTKAISRIL